tara:strand:+ start:2785 stop:3273 length:489 start_codon:yes stop_codon:yes gene_type:complete
MSNNNFTYLDDIIDMDEPGNQVEERNESFSIPPNPNQPNITRGISSTPSSHRQMYNQQHQMYTPHNNTDYMSNRSIQQFDSNLLPKNSYQPDYSSQELYEPQVNSENFNYNIGRSMGEYQKLCYICQQINNRNNARFHYVYLIIIVFLFIVILMLLKKVLNV